MCKPENTDLCECPSDVEEYGDSQEGTMFLLVYFGILVLTLAVLAGGLSWYTAVFLGVALFIVERRFISASHITDGDHASDEHGIYREQQQHH